MSDQVLKSQIAVQSLAERVLPVTVLALLGVFLVLGVGFAGASEVHNAAHDARHAFSFPCH